MFRGLGSSLRNMGEVSDSWFTSWLNGHLMFLRYLLASSNICKNEDAIPARIRAEVAVLVEFIENMPRLLFAMRDALSSRLKFAA